MTVGKISCFFLFGWIAKGLIISEIDILVGYSAKIADISTMQFRILKKSKDPVK